jgi:hypothetical protein
MLEIKYHVLRWLLDEGEHLYPPSALRAFQCIDVPVFPDKYFPKLSSAAGVGISKRMSIAWAVVMTITCWICALRELVRSWGFFEDGVLDNALPFKKYKTYRGNRPRQVVTIEIDRVYMLLWKLKIWFTRSHGSKDYWFAEIILSHSSFYSMIQAKRCLIDTQ